MGGLTALYCPPEALNGRPSGHSDQYSLAIVYQEMLTGQLPFGGRTAAQLAAQHLHSPPMLAVLPPSDQPIVARALSKNPDQRFPSCRMFADTLVAFEESRSTSVRRPVPAARRPIPYSRAAKTEPLSLPASPNANAAPGLSSSTIKVRLAASEIRDLPRIDLASADSRSRPTVFVGVGRTAGRILSQLRCRLRTRYRRSSGRPRLADAAARYGLERPRSHDLQAGRRFDSCPKHVGHSLAGAQGLPRELEAVFGMARAAAGSTTFPGRCRRKVCVRSAGSRLSTTARRFSTVCAAPSRRQRARKPSTDRGKQQDSNSPVNRPTCLSSRRLPGEPEAVSRSIWVTPSAKYWASCNCPISASLVFSRIRRAAKRHPAIWRSPTRWLPSRSCGTSAARRGYFPGDPSCDLPAFYENHATFHETYFVHLGNELGDREFESAADRLAEYLYQNTLAPGALFFDESRRVVGNGTDENSLAADRLRTFGLALFDAPDVEPEQDDGLHAPSGESAEDTRTDVEDTQQLDGAPAIAGRQMLRRCPRAHRLRRRPADVGSRSCRNEPRAAYPG